jgi:hypothetical protein
MNVKQTLEQAIYGYDPTEFMPIRDNGELVNRGEFMAYKAGQLTEAVGHAAHTAFETTLTVGQVILDHIAQEP